MLRIGKSTPFEEDIEKATNENMLTEDWSLIMQICDNAINYQDGAKFCFKAILKRLHHNVPRVVLHTLTLLDACVKNCDRRFLLLIASMEFTTEVRKLLGKMHPSAALKLKEILQRWSLEEFKDDSELGIIPSLYYKLKSEGVEFPSSEKEKRPAPPVCTDPDAVTSQEEENDIIKAIEISLKDTGGRYDASSEYGSSSTLRSESLPKSLPEPFKVRTLYDFDAAEDNELTIKEGEIVLVLDNSNSSWWKGSNHRGEGLFPANFVTEDLVPVPVETTVVTTSVEEIPPDTTFTGEVKLNEEKIESVINWLNDTDPAGESLDPADMLRMEDEVLKMTPLIEDNLQSIDKRLAMLNLVNEKIMSAFDLFHSLSDHMSTLQKYPDQYNTIGPMPFPQAQGSMPVPTSTVFQNMQPIPAQQIMYVPQGSQYTVPDGQTSNKPISADQSQVPGSTQGPVPVTMPQALPMNSDTLNAAVPSSAGQVGQPNVIVNPYNPNAMGGFYPPTAMPFPFQYPGNPPNMQPQGERVDFYGNQLQ